MSWMKGVGLFAGGAATGALLVSVISPQRAKRDAFGPTGDRPSDLVATAVASVVEEAISAESIVKRLAEIELEPDEEVLAERIVIGLSSGGWRPTRNQLAAVALLEQSAAARAVQLGSVALVKLALEIEQKSVEPDLLVEVAMEPLQLRVSMEYCGKTKQLVIADASDKRWEKELDELVKDPLIKSGGLDR